MENIKELLIKMAYFYMHHFFFRHAVVDGLVFFKVDITSMKLSVVQVLLLTEEKRHFFTKFEIRNMVRQIISFTQNIDK